MSVSPEQHACKIYSSTGDNVLNRLYHLAPGQRSFWSSAPEDFEAALEDVVPSGDEDNIIALDMALDLPWRQDEACHRLVVLLTDEPPETGYEPKDRAAKVPQLIEKLNALRVKLLVVSPYSDIYAEIQAADGADYIQLEDDEVDGGLSGFDFNMLFDVITKSVSVGTLQGDFKSVDRGLFNQDKWISGAGSWNPGEAR